MRTLARRPEPTLVRRVFEAWSIEIPASFAETFISDDGYWHAYGPRRSVSLTSLTVSDERGSNVSAEALARQIPAEPGEAVSELPGALPGWAVIANAPEGSRASQMLSGMVATEGRLLLATITADDLAWARATWLSIRSHPIERRSEA